MRTVALNLTQKISVISRPLRQPLLPERSLRSAHRLSAESRSKAKTAGDHWSPLRSGAKRDRIRRGGHCPPDNPSVGFADTSLYTREALAAAAGFGQTGSSAPANRTGTIKKSRLRRAAIFDCTSYLMLSCMLRVVLVTAGTVVVSLETVTSPANILATSAL